MKEHEEILLGGMFRPTEQNCPTREGELIESLDKIHDIPNPRVGMRVYVENTGKEYIIKSLKEKTIGGVIVPGAVVHEFEESDRLLKGDIEVLRQRAVDIRNSGISNINADTLSLKFASLENSVTIYDIPAATPERAGVMSAKDKRKLDAAGSTKVTWGSASNMNDFKTPGVYDIYGERTRQDDNLPILNASSGHSIAARLTVVASTLQPANNEICVTQFLMLSNRLGGEGNMYVRTYNENNSPFMNGWAPWQKLQGIREGYIFTDSLQVNPAGGIDQISGVTGLNNMIDNGIYTGIYTDDPTFQAPTFIDTFTLIVINNYAVVGQSGGLLKRTISQLKYAIDAITNQVSVKIRTKTDGDDAWSAWTDIGGGGSQEIDITDAVKAYGLPTLIAQGFAKEGVTYKVTCYAGEIPVLDSANKIKNHIYNLYTNFDDKVTFKIFTNKLDQYKTFFIDCYIGGSTAKYYKYVITNLGNPIEEVKVSADMTAL